MDSVYDLIIVGGGPAGLSAAIYAGRSERRTLLLEKGSYGGRINDTYEIRNLRGLGLRSVRPAMRNSSRERKSMCWEPVTRPLRNRII